MCTWLYRPLPALKIAGILTVWHETCFQLTVTPAHSPQGTHLSTGSNPGCRDCSFGLNAYCTFETELNAAYSFFPQISSDSASPHHHCSHLQAESSIPCTPILAREQVVTKCLPPAGLDATLRSWACGEQQTPLLLQLLRDLYWKGRH